MNINDRINTSIHSNKNININIQETNELKNIVKLVDDVNENLKNLLLKENKNEKKRKSSVKDIMVKTQSTNALISAIKDVKIKELQNNSQEISEYFSNNSKHINKDKEAKEKKNIIKSYSLNYSQMMENVINFKKNENNKSELESDSESKNEEKKTGLKRKKFRVRNIKIKKYGEKYEEKKEKHVLDYDLEKNIDHESLKKHMKLGNIHTSNYNYLAKSTENVDLNYNNEKNSEEKKTGKKKKKIQKKNIKIIKNEKKNNYLYSRIENLFIIYEEAIKNETKFSEIYLLFLIENNFILQTIISDSFINNKKIFYSRI